MKVLEKLILAAVDHYQGDSSRPSVTLSYLDLERDDESYWYASLCRYEAPFGGKKRIVCSITATTLNEAITGLARLFLEIINERPLQKKTTP